MSDRAGAGQDHAHPRALPPFVLRLRSSPAVSPPPPTAGAAIIRRNKISPIRVPLSRGYAGSEARHIRYRGRLSQLSYREEIDRRRTHATSRRRRRRDIARTFAQGT